MFIFDLIFFGVVLGNCARVTMVSEKDGEDLKEYLIKDGEFRYYWGIYGVDECDVNPILYEGKISEITIDFDADTQRYRLEWSKYRFWDGLCPDVDDQNCYVFDSQPPIMLAELQIRDLEKLLPQIPRQSEESFLCDRSACIHERVEYYDTAANTIFHFLPIGADPENACDVQSPERMMVDKLRNLAFGFLK